MSQKTKTVGRETWNHLRNDAELFPPGLFFGVFAELGAGAELGFLLVAIGLEDLLVVLAQHLDVLPLGDVDLLLQVHDVVLARRFGADLPHSN